MERSKFEHKRLGDLPNYQWFATLGAEEVYIRIRTDPDRIGFVIVRNYETGAEFTLHSSTEVIEING